MGGIYFADCASKSANYVHASPEQPYGLLILTEAALGNMHELTEAKFMNRAPPPCHSVWGKGKTIPSDDAESVMTIHGAKAYKGPLVESAVESKLLYNEFVIYDQA